MALRLPRPQSLTPSGIAQAVNYAFDLLESTINSLGTGGGTAGVVQQGARDATVQAWFIDHNGVAQPIFDNNELVDNAAFTDGATKVKPVGYILDEVAGTALTENDVGAARMDSKRAQVAVIEDATTRGQRAAVSAGGALKVDGSAATQPISGTVDTELETPAALGDGQANPTLPRVGAAGLAWNGLTWDRVRSTGGFLQVTGRETRGSAVAGNPVLAGGRSASYPTKPSSVSAGTAVDVVTDLEGVLLTRPRTLNTYTAIYRLAARPYALSNAFGAAGRKQYATIHHTALSTKTVLIRRVEVALESASAAAIAMADLVRITTAPATGNPAITPSPMNPGNPAAEATCLALPTTAGTEGAIHSMLEWNLGITAAGSTVNPPPPLTWLTLWPQTQGAPEAGEDQYPTMRAGTLEGFAVTVDASAAATVKGYVVIEFTEE